jgi:caffeoyl-CoA O-methyltransferase
MTSRAPRPVADPEMDAYAGSHSTAPTDQLKAIAASTRAWSEYPGMMVDAAEGELLAMLVATSGASRILEVGTFSGYSAVAMAEAMPSDGRIDTLELNPGHAAKAQEHIEQAGFAGRIRIHVGEALTSLSHLQGPYDFCFIDADKPAYPAYYDAVMPLLRRSALIVADNVLRGGLVLDAESQDPSVRGMRDFNDRVAIDPRVQAVMLTVRDGVTVIRVA